MTYRKLLPAIICINILLLGCRHHESAPDTNNEWNQITIWSEGTTKITLFNNDDLSHVYVFHTGSFFSPLAKNTKPKVDTIDARFTPAEKDSIFSVVSDLFNSPPKSKINCTDFVGKLELIIDYGYVKRKIEYSGICDWNNYRIKPCKCMICLKGN
ncbi:MAG: hypothetical protein ACTHMI_03595 [Mucilaginibacter sp.]